MRADRPLLGRTAMITGASRGIGAASARSLAALGADIIATYRSGRDDADELAAHVQTDHGVQSHTLPFDLVAPGAVEELLAAVAKITDGVDILVANAAAPYPKVALRELTAQQLTAKLGEDIAAVHQLVTATAPGMIRRGYGRIILIGSLHANGPSAPGMAASGVSKAALAAYVGYAVDELTGPGVTIKIIHPGYIATEASSHLPPAIPAMLTALTPSGRAGTPDDIAGVVALLAGPGADFLNGAAIPVAGGLNHPVSLRRLTSQA